MKPATFVENFSIEDEVERMPYVPFGNTGLLISKLSLGSAVFGGESFYGDYRKEEAQEVIIWGIRKGVNFIDSGPHYGSGLAETFLGEVLKQVPRNSYYISTKVGRMENYFNFKADAVTDSFEQSLKRLQLDFVDFVFIHDVEFADSVDVILNETLPAVEKFVQSGKAKFIGISAYPVTKLLEVVEKSKVKIDCVLSYSRDTLIDDTLQDFLPTFEEKGVAVINAGVIGMRLLSNVGPMTWHPATEETKELCRAASQFCKEKGVELGRLALYHSVNQPGPCTCLVGMSDLKTHLSNFEVLQDGITKEEEEVLEHIQKNFFTPSKRYHWEGFEVEKYREQKFIY